MRNIILGPPGTGKTTRLLQIVEQRLSQGVPPDRIAFLAFTRRAAHEASERAADQFGLDPRRDLPYFKTLHSFATHMIGATSFFDEKAAEDFFALDQVKAALSGVKVTGHLNRLGTISSVYQDVGFDHNVLRPIMLAKNMGVDLRTFYDKSDVGKYMGWNALRDIAACLDEYKKHYDLLDYSDVIHLFCERKASPKLHTLIVDEGQDLSRVQRLMVDAIEARSEESFIAGDDDQSIYGFAGADTDNFIRLEGNVEILRQSHRIPRAHHRISQQIVHRIQDRRPKEFNPRDEEGVVKWHRNIDAVDLSKGNWLLLGRTGRDVYKIQKSMCEKVLNYTRLATGNQLGERYRAVQNWETLIRGGTIPVMEAKLIVKLMKTSRSGESRTEIEYGARSKLNKLGVEYVTLEFMRQELGLNHCRPWPDALHMVKDNDRKHLTRCLNIGLADEVPRITIGTIHSAKGAEADNVMLMTDGVVHDNPDEHRTFYVGATRAKQELHLIKPQRRKNEYPFPS